MRESNATELARGRAAATTVRQRCWALELCGSGAGPVQVSMAPWSQRRSHIDSLPSPSCAGAHTLGLQGLYADSPPFPHAPPPLSAHPTQIPVHRGKSHCLRASHWAVHRRSGVRGRPRVQPDRRVRGVCPGARCRGGVERLWPSLLCHLTNVRRRILPARGADRHFRPRVCGVLDHLHPWRVQPKPPVPGERCVLGHTRHGAFGVHAYQGRRGVRPCLDLNATNFRPNPSKLSSRASPSRQIWS